MERALFTHRFREAIECARDCARRYIEEPLPDQMVFRVCLNASYDGNPLHKDEKVFPEDSAAEVARRLSRCTADDVVSVLWRDGMVPQWINLSVIGENGTATLIEVLACGRFTANDALLYHQHEGWPPFHALGPTLPVGFEEGQKFSIYDRAACRNPDDLARAAQHAAKVWSLELDGEDFNDEVVSSLPVFERMHILELRASRLTGPGLVGLSRQPKLRHLRIYLSPESTFSAAPLPELPHLETLTIEDLPGGAWGFPVVVAHAPRLVDLSLSTAGDLVLDAQLRSAFRSLTLRARTIEGAALPEVLASLCLEIREARDEDIERLLARVEAVTHLGLRGTPVSEELVESILSRWKLEYLDVMHTLVGDDCVRRIRARYPKLRTHPNPDFKMPEFENDS